MPENRPSRRAVLRGASTVATLFAATGLPALPARPAEAASDPHPVPADQATVLWYTAPGTEASMMSTGLPVGNGRLGALLTGDPSHEAYTVSDVTCWTGGPNTSLGSDGQYPWDYTAFGSPGMLAQVHLDIPAHAMAAVSEYRRQLDLSNGVVSAWYRLDGVTYRRDVYASHPDDVIVVHLTQSGGGAFTGSMALNGTREEDTVVNAAAATASFTASLPNRLRYAALVHASGTGGALGASDTAVTFTGCSEVLLVVSGGTDYSPSAPGFMEPGVEPSDVASRKAAAAARRGAEQLLSRHQADYRRLQRSMSVDLGVSDPALRTLPTDQRLAAASLPDAAPDPELHAAYIQFGRYLMISSSRSSLPVNLQGPWQTSNNPPWMSDYHTDINLQMNYWLPDRTGLGACYDPFPDYCVAQLPGWTRETARFNDPGNPQRNTSGELAGWTVTNGCNAFGGLGGIWNIAGNAWLCTELFAHYEYTLDPAYLRKIYPLLEGACRFWEARLVPTTYTDSAGVEHTVLVDDHDWSPEHGPDQARGITYAQELVWQLFEDFRRAASALDRDTRYAAVIADLQARLYLPRVSGTTGWLEEWMTPDNLDTSEIGHRHLSPLVGLFPGDRITADGSPADLLAGVTNLLTARGLTSYGWGVAWRSACWARLKNAANAYQCFVNGLAASVHGSTGTAGNLLDIYGGDTFQIDANFGLPSAAIEMLVYSRPGLVQLLPALPAAWAASGQVTGVGVRGGFTADFAWDEGHVTSCTLHNIGPARATTTLASGDWSRRVEVPAGRSVTLRSFPSSRS